MTKRLEAALLGATGAVGQRYASLLASHPSIHLSVLMGGESAGKKYGEATKWLSPDPVPKELAAEKVRPSVPESADGCDLVFSALPAEGARDVEPRFAKAGFAVVSEASAHRLDPDVPLMIPEVNPEHLRLIGAQRKSRGWKGSLVTTPNCTVTGLAMVLKPLMKLSICKAIVTTMQAVSGAGYPGVSSLLIMENVIPYIKDEEEKVENEATKILGDLNGGEVRSRPLSIAITCNRVPVLDGHLEALYCDFDSPVRPDEVVSALESFAGEPQKLGLPSAPTKPIIVTKDRDRPQPRLDRMAGSVPGMSVVVGRVRKGADAKSIQLVLLSHNTIRGAAGSAILTAELMQAKGYLR